LIIWKAYIDKPSVNKIFTNILSGNIEPGQLLFFTTNSIFDYVSEEKIEKVKKCILNHRGSKEVENNRDLLKQK